MAEHAEDSAATWLTGLNGTDISRNITAFEHSSFGKLPNELLRNIVQYVPKRYLPALARISPVLRELAEERLYQHIILRGLTETYLYYNEKVIWPLYRTLVSRPDLADRVKIFECTAREKRDRIEVDVIALSLHDRSLYSVAKASLNQTTLLGCIVLQRIPNVDKVCLQLFGASTNTDESSTLPDPLRLLMPVFDRVTAHTLHFAGLQNLTKLDFSGCQFHWTLAKLPCLRWLRLSRPCYILNDEAPNEVSTSVTRLEIYALADILRSHCPFYSFSRAFLSHFPALLELKLTIYVFSPDHIWVPNIEEKSYETLLERLSPVASHLRSLEMGVFNTDEEVHIPCHGGNDRANEFLIDILPASDFKDFRRLEKLVVPYQCLLGHTDSPSDLVLSPDLVLPATLQYLQIDCPQILVYDWLAQLHTVRRMLPVLSEIKLYSQLPYGDEYPVMYYEHREHPALRILSDLDISLTWAYRVGDWKEEWDEYDLEVPKVIEWLEGLGA